MFRNRKSSITARLTWMNVLVSAAALVVALAAFAIYEVAAFRHDMIRALSTEAQIVGYNSISAELFQDPQSAEKTLAALRCARQVTAAEIYTPDGQLFAGYWRDPKDRLEASSERIRGDRDNTVWFRDGKLVVIRRIKFHGKVQAIVLIQSGLGEMISRLKVYAVIVAGVLTLCFIAVLLVSSNVRSGIAEPITRLAATARTVSHDKNYSVRTPLTGNGDEVDLLIESFNEMLAQIQVRDAALQAAQNELEMRVEQRTQQLRGVNEDLEAFSYSVSHDLRAPLRQISGFSKILVQEASSQLDAPARRYLTRIQEGAERMSRLIDDLLNMGRIGRQEMVSRPADLGSVLAEAMLEVQGEAQGRRIEWRVGAMPTMECDPGLMKVVFTNLLSNAVKYTGPREVAVIEVGQTMQDREPVIFVRDNGAGFDTRYAHKLFGIFQRLHSSAEFDGNGIGLATVHRIIQRHGGRIWAESELGKGAAFFFTLQAAKQGAAATESPARLENPGARPVSSQSLTAG